MGDKIAVVTGSNKGIGYVIVRELCRRGVGVVYLTARDEKRGIQAVENLKKEGFNPNFHQLEVTDKESVKHFAKYLKEKHDGIDILINNAGVINKNFRETTYQDSVHVLNVNYYSILTIQEYFFPILKENARVINISSDAGHISNIMKPYWVNRLIKDDLQLEDVNAFVSWFLESVKNRTLNVKDFVEDGLLAYRVSKVALSALTRVQQKQVGRGISVNSLHPGFIKTDMTKYGGFLTLDGAGEAPAFLALDIDQAVKGKYFWFDKTQKEWTDHELKVHCRFAIFMQHVERARSNGGSQNIK